jgi:phage terminase small subunit
MSEANASGKPKRPKKPLTIQHIKFCEIYAEKGNATQAFLDAGFEAGTRDSAHVMAWRLLRQEGIRTLIRALREEAVTAARASVDRIAATMANTAFADRGDLFDANGRLLPPDQWPDDISSAIESIELEDGKPSVVKTAKRMDALRALAAWRRMLGRDVETQQAPPAPLVIGGEASPDKLFPPDGS